MAVAMEAGARAVVGSEAVDLEVVARAATASKEATRRRAGNWLTVNEHTVLRCG